MSISLPTFPSHYVKKTTHTHTHTITSVLMQFLLTHTETHTQTHASTSLQCSPPELSPNICGVGHGQPKRLNLVNEQHLTHLLTVYSRAAQYIVSASKSQDVQCQIWQNNAKISSYNCFKLCFNFR